MKQEKPLKEYLEELIKESPIKGLGVASKFLELEALERYFNAVLGVELEIYVKPAEIREGRWFGKGVIESLT